MIDIAEIRDLLTHSPQLSQSIAQDLLDNLSEAYVHFDVIMSLSFSATALKAKAARDNLGHVHSVARVALGIGEAAK